MTDNFTTSPRISIEKTKIKIIVSHAESKEAVNKSKRAQILATLK